MYQENVIIRGKVSLSERMIKIMLSKNGKFEAVKVEKSAYVGLTNKKNEGKGGGREITTISNVVPGIVNAET